jgi:hypothetical protein
VALSLVGPFYFYEPDRHRIHQLTQIPEAAKEAPVLFSLATKDIRGFGPPRPRGRKTLDAGKAAHQDLVVVGRRATIIVGLLH